ncbi:FG-GAP-like repeat-containing protein [bacterium]|nr:FG-GAP-like repeat-containing protein [bacterium]
MKVERYLPATCTFLYILFSILFFQNIGYSQKFKQAVGSQFIKVEGIIAADSGSSLGASWCDFDNDGDLDLFVACGTEGSSENNRMYRNDGGGIFFKITDKIIVNDGGKSQAGSWADYDNDGDFDLFVANYNQKNFLYRNDGNSNFTKITEGPVVNDIMNAVAGSWSDYDNDGDLDLFVANQYGQANALYQNQGNGAFVKVTSGDIVTTVGNSRFGCWGDYDNDGNDDLYVTNWYGSNFLFHNNGNGSFTRITTGAIVTDSDNSESCNWIDYNNDGFLDLFVVNHLSANCLYRNNGNGTFTKITSLALVTEHGAYAGAAWADFDNDGDLDVFLSGGGNSANANYLYRNDGNDTFTQISDSPLTTEIYSTYGCIWGDYDDDGDADIFLSNIGNVANSLFQNSGNSNHWLQIKCVGVISNKSAIGAKLRVKATINGIQKWQLQELQVLSGNRSQNNLSGNFGLGDAIVVDSLIIEWPSGIVTKRTNVAVDQFLTIQEVTEEVTLALNQNFTFPGQTGVLEMSLENSKLVSGLQFNLMSDPNVVKIDSIKLLNRAGEMEILFNKDIQKAIVFSSSQKTIESGDGVIGRLYYSVNAASQLFDTVDVLIDNILASGTNNQPASVYVVPGKVITAIRGDVNLDQSVNVLDVQETARIIVGLPVFTQPSLENKEKIADVYPEHDGDGEVNLFDLNTIIEWSLGEGGLLKTYFSASSIDSMVIYSGSTVDLGGIQFDIHNATIVSVKLGVSASTMQLAFNSTRVLVYSLNDETIAPGYHPVATIYYETGGSPVVSNIVAGNTSGQGLYTASNGNTIMVDAMPVDPEHPKIPTQVFLHQNYPNPFNPETTIKYELITRAKIKLAIFNALGQEVVTLVNSIQEPGFKAIKWSGQDHTGKTVSSGIYFYRLQVDKRVFSKKMLFIK